MELHPLLSQLDKNDLERYVDACKNYLMGFLEELCLSDDLALQVLEGARTDLLNSDINTTYQTSIESRGNPNIRPMNRK